MTEIAPHLEGFAKVDALALHDEFVNVAALAALAETTPGAGIGENDESRRTGIGVERAKTGIVLTGAFEIHALGDNIHNIQAVFDFFDRIHSSGPFRAQQRGGRWLLAAVKPPLRARKAGCNGNYIILVRISFPSLNSMV